MKILFVAHSADLSGGANRSLLSIMRGLQNTHLDDYHLQEYESGRETILKTICDFIG